MRCEPNDLAVVVDGIPAANIGRFVTVTHCLDVEGVPCWSYAGWLLGHDGQRAQWVADCCLQPIRPPRPVNYAITTDHDFAHG